MHFNQQLILLLIHNYIFSFLVISFGIYKIRKYVKNGVKMPYGEVIQPDITGLIFSILCIFFGLMIIYSLNFKK